MINLHKSIEINAPVNKVYSYLDNPQNAPEVITNLIDVKDVEGSGLGCHYKWTWNMAGIKLNGENTHIEDVPDKRLVINSKGGIESTWTYNFEAHGDSTVLNLDIDYKVPVPVLGKLAEKLILKRNERDAETGLMNLKERLEQS